VIRAIFKIRLLKRMYLWLFWRSRRALQALQRTATWLASAATAALSADTPRTNMGLLLDAFTPTPLKRVGSLNDGGYYIPDIIGMNYDALFSPGVDVVSEFELEFANSGVHCYLLDGSVDKPPTEHSNFTFERAWLSSRPKEGFRSLTLGDWILESGMVSSHSLILQMDIEGSEWEVLMDSTSETLSQFSVIVVEFHSLQLSRRESKVEIVKAVFEKLLKNHVPVWMHPNNGDVAIPIYSRRAIPPLLEVTFMRRAELHSILKKNRHEDFLAYAVNDKRFQRQVRASWLEK
jgi:hypothetical protein